MEKVDLVGLNGTITNDAYYRCHSVDKYSMYVFFGCVISVFLMGPRNKSVFHCNLTTYRQLVLMFRSFSSNKMCSVHLLNNMNLCEKVNDKTWYSFDDPDDISHFHVSNLVNGETLPIWTTTIRSHFLLFFFSFFFCFLIFFSSFSSTYCLSIVEQYTVYCTVSAVSVTHTKPTMLYSQ